LVYKVMQKIFPNNKGRNECNRGAGVSSPCTKSQGNLGKRLTV